MARKPASDFSSLAGLLAGDDLPHLKSLGRRERRAAETCLRLFRCALQLFAEHGFQNVTVEDITEAADVGKGTFFNYFESKDDVLGVMAEIQLGKVREALAAARSGEGSIKMVFHHMLERMAEEPGRSPQLARALLASFLASERIRKLIDHTLCEARKILVQIVEIGQRNGEIDPALKKDQLALLVQQSFLGTVMVWSLHGKPKLNHKVEMTFQYLWRAISVPGREPMR